MNKQKTAVILCGYFFVNFNAAWVVQTLFFRSIGIDYVQIGVIFATYQVSKILFDIPTGLLSDKYNRKHITIISIVCTIISLLSAVQFKSFIGIVFSIFIYGIGYVMSSAALSALIVESVIKEGQESLAKINAYTRISFYISIASASLLAGVLSERYSFEFVYWLTAGLQLFAILFVSLMPHSAKAQSNNKVEKSKKLKISNVIKYINSNKKYRFLLLVNIIFSIGYIPSDSYYMNILTDNGIRLEVAGAIIGFQFVLSALLGAFALKYIGESQHQNILKRVPIISVILLIGFCIISNVYIAIALYIIQVLLMCIYNPIGSSHLHFDFEPKYRATALSIQTFVMSIVALLTQTAFGYFASIFELRIALLPLFAISLLLLVLNLQKNFEHSSTHNALIQDVL